MSSEEKEISNLGSLFVVGLKGKKLLSKEVDFIRSVRPSGVILFRRNIESARQLRSLVKSVYKIYPKDLPPFVGIDQEGGRVERLCQPFTSFPGNRHLGRAFLRTGDMDLARRQALAIGRELRSVGINLNFSPVADLDSNPKNPIIGPRAFGKSSILVSKLVRATIEGYSKAGVLCCAKHFPGHGESFSDSHKVLPTVKTPPSTLARREWRPFRAAIRAGVPMIMTAHIRYPALEKRLPATMSKRFMTEILRQKMGFEGIIVSDDLEMKAISSHYDLAKATLTSLRAGVDLFLVCGPEISRSASVVRGLAQEGGSDAKFLERISAANRLILGLRRNLSRRYASNMSGAVGAKGWPSHQALAKKIEKLGT